MRGAVRSPMNESNAHSRILVTGGLGTVGAGLIAELRKRGHHVVSCYLQHQADEIGFSLRTDVEVPFYARCDVGDFRQIERVFERCGPFDYVYHCAAEFGRWNGEDFYETLWRTNAIGTKNVIRLAGAARSFDSFTSRRRRFMATGPISCLRPSWTNMRSSSSTTTR